MACAKLASPFKSESVSTTIFFVLRCIALEWSQPSISASCEYHLGYFEQKLQSRVWISSVKLHNIQIISRLLHLVSKLSHVHSFNVCYIHSHNLLFWGGGIFITCKKFTLYLANRAKHKKCPFLGWSAVTLLRLRFKTEESHQHIQARLLWSLNTTHPIMLHENKIQDRSGSGCFFSHNKNSLHTYIYRHLSNSPPFPRRNSNQCLQFLSALQTFHQPPVKLAD